MTGTDGEAGRLRRRLGTAGAVATGLGSILGTGIFVSLGLAAASAGDRLPVALVLAAVLAGLNGLSSAALAAAFPVSGGTYEYGHRTLGPTAGFAAGWMFLAAKSASAATAALGIAAHVLSLVGAPAGWRVPAALVAVAGLTALVHQGARRTATVNTALVAVTVGVLGALVAAAFTVEASPTASSAGTGTGGLFEATALLFVAYTGYGRIATLGEEVRAPERTIPRAVLLALGAALALYLGVASAALHVLGPEGFAAAARETAAPLQAVAWAASGEALAAAVGLAAVTAMLGVATNLLLGLSRVLLAMARRGDAPRALAAVDPTGTTPGPAVLATGALVGALVLVGDVETTWSFSALTVLVYYAITNAAALRLPPGQRRFPRAVSWAGLLGCVGLAAWVEPVHWLVGGAWLALGLAARAVARRAV